MYAMYLSKRFLIHLCMFQQVFCITATVNTWPVCQWKKTHRIHWRCSSCTFSTHLARHLNPHISTVKNEWNPCMLPFGCEQSSYRTDVEFVALPIQFIQSAEMRILASTSMSDHFNFFPFDELSASQATAAISLSHFLLFGTPLPSSLRNNMSVFMRVPRWPCMFNSGSAVGRIWGASMCAYLSWLLFMHPLLKGATDNAFILAAIFKILA